MAWVSGDAQLEEAIAREEERLSELDGLRDSVAGRLDGLRAMRDRAASESDAVVQATTGSAWSAQRKLALFAGLFRGREEVFPTRWEKPETGRSGWAPRCSNEWVRGVCSKPRVRCGACPNQAFVAPARSELLAHLQGRHVMGVYPLIPDDTCWLLAMDLDGSSWRHDVAAIRDACSELGVIPAVERSRSGEGAHVWFFFSVPVPAALARRFGLMVLTNAMGRSTTLGMASYDRLFPSQDTLPKGGFGNLIALPLQPKARRDGNTLFLDDELDPFEDQWSYLDSLARIAPDHLEGLVARADADGRVLGVSDPSAEDDAPWRPPRSLTSRLAAAKMPEAVSVTLAQRLYVSREGLPAALLDALRRLATFSNPLFLERQRMRLSTALTPRVIACFEELDRFLVLPRGCRTALEKLLDDAGVHLELVDERATGVEVDVEFTGKLTAVQVQSAQDMLAHELGVLCGAPGIGRR